VGSFSLELELEWECWIGGGEIGGLDDWDDNILISGLLIYFIYNWLQSTFYKKGWVLSSIDPFNPNLFIGFLYINLLIKSPHSILYPLSYSLFIYTYFYNIISHISFLLLPLYGLLFNIIS